MKLLETTKGKVLAAVLALAVTLVTIWALVLSFGGGSSSKSSNSSSTTPSASSSSTSTAPPNPVSVATDPVITHGVTGKSLTDDQKNAEAAATKILNLAGNNPKKQTPTQLLAALDRNDTSVLDKNIFPLVRFSTNANDALKKNTWESLVSLNILLNKQNNTTTLKPVSSDTYKNVFVDQKLGEAFVPIANYSKNGAQFSLEMVYVNKQWVLAPYSLVDAVKLSAALASGQNGGVTGQNPSSSSSATSK